MSLTPHAWQEVLAQRKQNQLRMLQHTEFALQVLHPDVFVSYRAAKSWAFQELQGNPVRYSGEPDHGWCVSVFADNQGFACSISQAMWNADHCGAVRPTGALAIVQAMLELRTGY